MAWIPLQISSLVFPYKLLSFWVTTRKSSNSGELIFFKENPIRSLAILLYSLQKVVQYDKKFLYVYVTSLCAFLLAPLLLVIQVGFAGRVLVLMEQVNLFFAI